MLFFPLPLHHSLLHTFFNCPSQISWSALSYFLVVSYCHDVQKLVLISLFCYGCCVSSMACPPKTADYYQQRLWLHLQTRSVSDPHCGHSQLLCESQENGLSHKPAIPNESVQGDNHICIGQKWSVHFSAPNLLCEWKLSGFGIRQLCISNNILLIHSREKAP